MDEQERSLAVAVLDASIASESRWRDAFAATANAIAQADPDGSPHIGADFFATTPWVAYPAEFLQAAVRTFLALGMTYEAVPADADDPSTPDRHVRPNPEPEVAPTVADHAQPTAPDVVPESVPPRPRAGRWTLLATGLVVGLLAGGGLVALFDPGSDEPSPESTASLAALPAPAPATAPLNPGLEPPVEGDWPAQWIRFTATDRIRTLPGLDGLTFPVKVPMNWQCSSVERAEGLSRHQCGAPAGSGQELGGELIVRECPAPCDGSRQTAMRTAEEAWGLRWVRCGPSSTYAETSSLDADGERRYGLVVVAYWRSGDGDIDQQLVLRMTAPVTGANQLRRVANYLRDGLIF